MKPKQWSNHFYSRASNKLVLYTVGCWVGVQVSCAFSASIVPSQHFSELNHSLYDVRLSIFCHWSLLRKYFDGMRRVTSNIPPVLENILLFYLAYRVNTFRLQCRVDCPCLDCLLVLYEVLLVLFRGIHRARSRSLYSTRPFAANCTQTPQAEDRGLPKIRHRSEWVTKPVSFTSFYINLGVQKHSKLNFELWAVRHCLNL